MRSSVTTAALRIFVFQGEEPDSELDQIRHFNRKSGFDGLVRRNTGQDGFCAVNVAGGMTQRVVFRTNKDVVQQTHITATVTTFVVLFVRDDPGFAPQRLEDDLRHHASPAG